METASPQLRALLYGRTSLDRSRGRSVDDQLTGLRGWAARENHRVVGELRDDGISASRWSRKARPDWQKAMDMITAGELDILGVWEISRSTRDRMVWASLVAACTEARVKIAVDGRVFDVEDPDDAYFLDQMVASGIRESAMTSKRTNRGSESRAAAGRPHGSLCYGYANEYDPATGKVLRRVQNPADAEIVREIARRLLAAESAASIAADLNSRGIPSPREGRWSGSNVSRLAQRPTLAGLRVYRGKVLEDVVATWEPILTVEQHRKLVARLTDPSRRSSRTGVHVRHLLPGVARCGICGGAVRALTRKLRSGGTTIVYNCRERFCFSRIAADVDAAVERLVVARLSQPDLLEALTADDPIASEAAENLARLRAKLDEARRLVAEDRLSLTSLVDLEARLLPQIEDAQRRARPRHVPTLVTDVAGPDAAARWAALSVASRREIVRALMTVRINRTGRRDSYVPFDPSAIEIIWKS